jgi:hypothetical protein
MSETSESNEYLDINVFRDFINEYKIIICPICVHKLFQMNRYRDNHDYYDHVKNCDGKSDGKCMRIVI